MISALKKRLGTSTANGQNGTPSPSHSKTPTGVHVISAELKKKFANGVDFNMKIVIRGDRNSGKTALWKRIQGQPFNEVYLPTEEIQATSIMWNYRACDYIVKLDVWDVVDESPKRVAKSEGLKLNNGDGPEMPVAACDAGFIDVYKNCHGVLLVFDITKPWTWQYAQRELDKIPSHIPVLLMGNKRDLEAERQVNEEDVASFLEGYHRKQSSHGKITAGVRYTQSSMKNAFGLKFLYQFLNIPFLFLQRDTLEGMLMANKKEIELTYEEMDLFDSDKTDSFDTYVSKQKENAQHAFSAEAPRPAGVKSISNHDNGTNSAHSTPQRQRRGSSSSDDHNRMVDTFEEDFDSDDEKIHEVYKKKMDGVQPEIDRSAMELKTSTSTGLISFPPPTVSTPDGSLNTPIAANADFDAWLENSPDIDSSKLSSIPLESSDDEGHIHNPLVTPIPTEELEEISLGLSGRNSLSLESSNISPHNSVSPVPKSKKKAGAGDKKHKKKGKKALAGEPGGIQDFAPPDASQYESL